MSSDPSAIASFEAAVLAWIGSDDAKRYAGSLVTRYRLTVSDDEVLADVGALLWERSRRTDLAVPDNPAAYCTRVMRNVVMGILRGRHTSLHDLEQAERLRERPGAKRAQPKPDDTVASVTIPAHLLDDVRLALETSGAAVEVVSGALTYVTVLAHDDCNGDRLPHPAAGANPTQAALWPAIWLSGQRERMFPTDGRDDTAQRRRRARAGEKITQLVARVMFSDPRGAPR